ncbi:unnamed protein product [Notodromas monacha]|uniref:G-protein coupled receptors family 1 profile domain-containing protein n=1 Tax=Notodromas monacha TaxID=399045 RepID=A0A7R9BN13_9CRUS|nr:unnamed protein product [Notodromas monacha]CAG0917130.1 unnamed protein product [Notodromas monacha]
MMAGIPGFCDFIVSNVSNKSMTSVFDVSNETMTMDDSSSSLSPFLFSSPDDDLLLPSSSSGATAAVDGRHGPSSSLPGVTGLPLPGSSSSSSSSSSLLPDLDTAAYEFIVHGICLPIVGLFGLVGNGLSMFILSRPQMRSSMNCCLLGLASCDSALILCCLLLFSVPSVHGFSGLFRGYYATLHHLTAPWLYPLALMAQTASIYITMTVTLERYVAVCRPLRARALCTYGRAKLYLGIIIAFSIAYNIPRFFEMSVKRVCYFGAGDDEADGVQLLHKELAVFPSALREDPLYVQVSDAAVHIY